MRRFWIVWLVGMLLLVPTPGAGAQTAEILNIFNEGAMVAEALGAAEALDDGRNRPDAVSLLRAVSGELEKRWTESPVVNPSSSAGMAADLAKAQTGLGDPTGRDRTLARIDAMLDRSASAEDRCIADFFLAILWMDLNSPEKARARLDEALEIGRALPRRTDDGENPYFRTVLSVADLLGRFGWPDRAEEILREIETADADERQAVTALRAALHDLKNSR